MPTIATADLDIEYRDDGPPAGSVVLLLHGWPDDASTWQPVAAALNAAGRRTIVPSLRGFGATRFRTEDAPRTGNAAMLAIDAVALLDALGVEICSVAGHDWGASVAEALAVGWPDRVDRLALLSTPPRLGGLVTPGFAQAQRYWYQWFQATQRGAEAIRADRRGFARMMWETWSPPGWFDAALFDRVAVAFDNPDWVDVTLHSYRSRWGEAEPDPRSRWLDDQVRAARRLVQPTVYLQGELDSVNPPSVSAAIADKFAGPFQRIVLPRIGHFPTREAPAAVAACLVTHFRD